MSAYRLQFDAHTMTLGRAHYDVKRLWRLVRRRKPKWLDIGLIHGYGRTKNSGFNLTNLLYCDTKFPIIALPNGKLIDGRHRMVKMQIRRRKRGRVHTITKGELEKCRIRRPAKSEITCHGKKVKT